MIRSSRCKVLACLLLAVLLAGLTTAASGTQMTVTAHSRGGMDFVHTSRAPGFCARWPGACTSGAALDLPLNFDVEARQGLAIRVPSRRQLTVSNERSGETHTLTFEVLALGLRVDASSGAVQGGCSVGGAQNAGAGSHYLWRINAPAQPSHCVAPLADATDSAQVQVSELGFAYRLSTPSPLKMSPGTYHGRLLLSVGAGADLDLGDGVSALSSDSLDLAVELTVEHDWRIDFAQGGGRLALAPPGGWENWGGRLPSRLYRDSALRIWSSGPFSVHLRCQFQDVRRCAIRNPGSDSQVPLVVALTLPSGFLGSGKPVNRVELPVGEGAALKLESVQPMLNQGGVLHFDVGTEQIQEMARHSGMEYTGDVTVIFDAGM